MLYNQELNVLGGLLQSCCCDPMTGWKRDGFCSHSVDDHGKHLVCAEMTQRFLDFSKSRGNDLSTPNEYFPGLKPGDRWCVCLMRIVEAFNAGYSPKIDLSATHISVLEIVPLSILEQMANIEC